MTEHGAATDAWPSLYARVLDADILVIAGPIWLGNNSPVTKRVIERLYACSHLLNDAGQYAFYGRVGGCLITGNEDGIKHCAMNILCSLQHLGYTIPPQAAAPPPRGQASPATTAIRPRIRGMPRARASDGGSTGNRPRPKEHAMFSELTNALIVDGLVLVAVLGSDLGRCRAIGPMRILRPLVLTAVIVPLFIATPVTHGTGLAVEIAGLLGGLAAAAMTSVYRSPETGKPVSQATTPDAIFWTLVIGARATFSYGAEHWFHPQLVSWAVAHLVTGAAITDGLIVMAVVMVLVRTVGLRVRASGPRAGG